MSQDYDPWANDTHFLAERDRIQRESAAAGAHAALVRREHAIDEEARAAYARCSPAQQADLRVLMRARYDATVSRVVARRMAIAREHARTGHTHPLEAAGDALDHRAWGPAIERHVLADWLEHGGARRPANPAPVAYAEENA